MSYKFCSILQFLSQFLYDWFGSCQDAVRGELHDREVLKHRWQAAQQQQHDILFELQTMQAVAHCIWYTLGTAVVSAAMYKWVLWKIMTGKIWLLLRNEG